MGPAILYSLFCILKKSLTFGIINRKSMIVNGGKYKRNPGLVEWYMPSSIQCTTFIACCDALRLPAIRIDLNLHVIYISPPFHVNYMHDGHKGGDMTVYSHIFQINFRFFVIFSFLIYSFIFDLKIFFSLSFQANPPISSHPIFVYLCCCGCVCVFICILYI